jgi:uncharacterized membrane protein
MILLVILANISIFLNIFLARPIFGFILSTIIPGFLFLRILNITKIHLLENLILSIGLSLSYLYLIGVILNVFILPSAIPLRISNILVAIDISIVLSIYLDKKFKRPSLFNLDLTIPKSNHAKIEITFAIIIFISSIIGTLIMNGSDNNSVVIFALVLILFFIIYLFMAKRISSDKCAYSLLIISTSILYISILRSNNLVGADIFEEANLAQNIVNSGYWSISQNILTLCLGGSILLPIYNLLLGLSIEELIKIVIPLIYSLTPLCIFFLVRKYFDYKKSLLSSIIYISQYFFIQDGMWPVRSGLGAFFSALFFYVLLTPEFNKSAKNFLCILFLFCIIVTHYSTSYIIFFLLLLCFFLSILASKLTFRDPMINPYSSYRIISLSFIFLALAAIFSWYGLNDVSNAVGIEFVHETLSNMYRYFYEDIQRNADSNAMFSTHYLTQSMSSRICYMSQMLTFLFIFIGSIYFAILCIMKIHANDQIIDKSDLDFKNRRNIYIYLSISSFLILSLIILIPFNNYDYGRVLMICLIMAAPMYAVGALACLRFFKKYQYIILTLIVVIQFLNASGLLFAFSGETDRTRNLGSINNGTSFMNVHDTEIATLEWIKKNKADLDTYGDGYSGATIFRESGVNINENYFYDNIMVNNSYLYLRYFNVMQKKVILRPYIGGENKLSNYLHLYSCKNKIFTTGETEIYL